MINIGLKSYEKTDVDNFTSDIGIKLRKRDGNTYYVNIGKNVSCAEVLLEQKEPI